MESVLQDAGQVQHSAAACMAPHTVLLVTCALLQNIMWQIYPRVDRLDCRALEIDGGGGPTLQSSRHLLAAKPELALARPSSDGPSASAVSTI